MQSCWTQTDAVSARYGVEGMAEQPIRARDAQAVAQARGSMRCPMLPARVPYPQGLHALVEHLFQLQTVRHDPPGDRGVIDVNPTCLPKLFHLQSRQAYATSHRTQVRRISCGTCTSLKRTALTG